MWIKELLYLSRSAIVTGNCAWAESEFGVFQYRCPLQSSKVFLQHWSPEMDTLLQFLHLV